MTLARMTLARMPLARMALVYSAGGHNRGQVTGSV